MRYMILIKHTQDYRGQPVQPALLKAMGEFMGANFKAGKFVDAGGLMSTYRGKKLKLQNGEVKVVDGPFTESKEIVGGFTLAEAASDQEALDLAKQFIELHRVHAPGMNIEVELRPLQTGAPGEE